MVEIEVKKIQRITNEQLGEFYAKFLQDENNIETFYQDLAYSIDENVPSNLTDFVSVVEAIAELSSNDIAEILQATAQYLRKGVDK